MERIKLFTDNRAVNEALLNTDSAIRIFNDLVSYYQRIDLDIKIPSDVLKGFITTNFREDVILDFVNTQYKKENKYAAKIGRGNLFTDLVSYLNDRVIVEHSFEFVEIENNKASYKTNYREDIEEKFSIYLTDEESISNFNELKGWIDKGNEIWEKFKAFNPHHSTLQKAFLHPAENGCVTMNLILLNFKK